MIGMQIDNGFIDFGNTEYTCPHCEFKHEDKDGKLLDKCNDKGYAKTKCKSCKKYFNITYDMMGDFFTFKFR